MPEYEKPGPAKGEAYGIAAVTQALQGLDFPCSKQDLLSKAGDREIEYRKGEPVRLGEILKGTEVDTFHSMSEVVSQVSDALHKEGRTGEERAA